LSDLQVAALMIAQDVLFTTEVEQLGKLVVRYKIPAIYVTRSFAPAGGLMAYGANQRDGFRQVGIYTGRILNGEAPSDLPVMQATKFDLVINLKTAKGLGLNLPLPLLGRADQVIE
jgi:putative ABC transport system substrate-binding protein